MSMRGWTQADVDAYLARQSANALKHAPAASGASTLMHIPEKPQTPAYAKPGGNRGKSAQPRRPNKTEERFNQEMLGGRGVYEGLTFRLPGGSRYTPDWVWFHRGEGGISIFCIEVKGSYRFGSQGRALVAFREARAAFPLITFSWWQWVGGKWEEKYAERE